jgi:hypothetical protein
MPVIVDSDSLGTGVSSATSPIGVWIDPDLGVQRHGLTELLGPGYRVLSGPLPNAGVLLLHDPSPGVVARLRRSHPRLGLLAVLSLRRDGGEDTAALLNAGADDAAPATNLIELSLRVQALARRL